MAILITGGAGYIGSFTARELAAAGYEVVVLDNISTGDQDRARWGPIHIADVRAGETVSEILRTRNIDTVIHLAASSHAGESILAPTEYFSNNFTGTVSLIAAMNGAGVRQLVFASSCAVYGTSSSQRMHEDHPLQPVSPYGESKLMAERALDWSERAYGLRCLSLRYFNVAGAEANHNLGEDFTRSQRILPRAIQAAMGDGRPLNVFGTNLGTTDGTAVRDYVHVLDVARANRAAVAYLDAGLPSATLNLGVGRGTSVAQILEEVERVLRFPVPVCPSPSRPGDPPWAVADTGRARDLLQWVPAHSSLEEIVASSIAYYLNRPAAAPLDEHVHVPLG